MQIVSDFLDWHSMQLLDLTADLIISVLAKQAKLRIKALHQLSEQLFFKLILNLLLHLLVVLLGCLLVEPKGLSHNLGAAGAEILYELFLALLLQRFNTLFHLGQSF